MAALEAEKSQLHYDLKRIRDMSQAEELPADLVGYLCNYESLPFYNIPVCISLLTIYMCENSLTLIV